MSYSQSYRAYAHYEGSVPYSGTVRYGASQNGGVASYSGYAHYSGDVPITYTIYVDTEPFDESVDNCNDRMDRLGGAVVAMNGAQCAEIAKTAEDVSNHIVNGFFGVVRSEISQDSARLKNIIVSQMALLKDYSERISQQKETMSSDYNRISSRYVKIFKDLDEECRKRILALNQKAFDISSEITDRQLRVPGLAVGGFVTSANEGCVSSDRIVLSSLKCNTRDVIGDLLENVSKDLRFSRNTKRVTFEKSCAEEGEMVYVPVIFSQLEDPDGKRFKCYVTDEVPQKEVCDAVEQFFRESDTDWKTSDDIDALIDREFNAYAEQVTDKRVYEEMKRLRNADRIETN